MVTHVPVSKYADHLPLYRQAQIYSTPPVKAALRAEGERRKS